MDDFAGFMTDIGFWRWGCDDWEQWGQARLLHSATFAIHRLGGHVQYALTSEKLKGKNVISIGIDRGLVQGYFYGRLRAAGKIFQVH